MISILEVKDKVERKIYIAGAHSRAQTLRVYLQYLYPDIQIESYLVDDMTENDSVVGDIPVFMIKEGLHTDYPVYIGTRRINHPKLIEELKSVGFSEIIPVTVDLDIQLRNEFIRKIYAEQGKKFVLIDDL